MNRHENERKAAFKRKVLKRKMNKSTHYVFPFGNLIATKEMECEEDFGDEEDTETNLFCTKGIMHSDLYHAS